MSCLCLRQLCSGLFRSYRTRSGHQSIANYNADYIFLVRLWTILGILYLVISLTMVASSYITNYSYDMEIALAFFVGTCVIVAIILGYICRFWWIMGALKKEVPDEEVDTVGDYVRDIFCLPRIPRGERTEPEGSSQEVITEIVTSL